MAEEQQQQQQQQQTPAALLASALNDTPGDTSATPPQDKTQDQPTAPKPGDKTAEKPAPQNAADAAPADPTVKTIQDMVEAATKPLRDELAALKAKPEALEKERRAYDAREDYLRNTMKNFPQGIARKLLPITEDKAALAAAGAEIEKEFKDFMQGMAASGRIKFIDVGGAARDGGTPITDFSARQQARELPKNATPQQLLAADLDNNPNPTHRS